MCPPGSPWRTQAGGGGVRAGSPRRPCPSPRPHGHLRGGGCSCLLGLRLGARTAPDAERGLRKHPWNRMHLEPTSVYWAPAGLGVTALPSLGAVQTDVPGDAGGRDSLRADRLFADGTGVDGLTRGSAKEPREKRRPTRPTHVFQEAGKGSGAPDPARLAARVLAAAPARIGGQAVPLGRKRRHRRGVRRHGIPPRGPGAGTAAGSGRGQSRDHCRPKQVPVRRTHAHTRAHTRSHDAHTHAHTRSHDTHTRAHTICTRTHAHTQAHT